MGPVQSVSQYFRDVIYFKSLKAVKQIKEGQAPSTQATLNRDPSLDEAHFNRPLPENAQVRDDDGAVFVNERTLPHDQVIVYKRLQWKGHYNTIGQPSLSGATPEMRSNAIFAFMDTKGFTPTEEEKRMVTRYFAAIELPEDKVSEDLQNKFMELMVRSGLIEPVKA